MHTLRSFLFAPGDAPAGGGGGAPPPVPPGGAPPPVPPAGGTPPPPGGAPPVTPWSTDFFKDGKINRDAYGRMPEGLRTLADGELKNIETPDQLMEKVKNLSALAGRKALAPLGANATAEERQAQDVILHQVMGAPEKPEGYAFKRPDNLPEAAWDDGYAKTIQGVLHKHHASPALAAELVAAQTAQVQLNLQAQVQYEQQYFKEQDDTFRGELGKQGLDYDKTLAMVTRAAATYGMPADAPMLKNAGVRMMMLKVAQSIGEAKFVGGEGSAANLKSDRAQAEDIVSNKDNPEYKIYWAGMHGNPENARSGEVREKVNKLYEAAAIAERKAAGGR